jgi:5'-phosphate synthase pdxT subunit
VTEHGPSVQVLAAVDGHVVAVRQDDILAVSFHPEITGDDRLHRAFAELAGARRRVV